MKKLILVGLIMALLITPVGCGKPEEEDSYEDFVAEYYQTKLALHLLQNKYDELEASYGRKGERGREYINAINTLQSENEALRVEMALVKGLGGSQLGKLEAVLNELNAFKAGRLIFIRETEQKYEALLVKYNAVTALYPPTHFANKDELVKWRASSGNMSGVGCFGLQQRALADGYIVSVCSGFDYCVAVAGGYWFKITPADNGLVEKIGKVE